MFKFNLFKKRMYKKPELSETINSLLWPTHARFYRKANTVSEKDRSKEMERADGKIVKVLRTEESSTTIRYKDDVISVSKEALLPAFEVGDKFIAVGDKIRDSGNAEATIVGFYPYDGEIRFSRTSWGDDDMDVNFTDDMGYKTLVAPTEDGEMVEINGKKVSKETIAEALKAHFD